MTIPRIDITTQDGQPTGKTSTISSALHKGLWHRGVHVVVATKTGYVVVQKRSNTMRMNPNMLDISCGGFVDQGEEPNQAAVRELREELGITAHESDLIPLFLRQKNHVWHKLKIHDRVILHCYLVVLDTHQYPLAVQPEEVSMAAFVPLRQAKRLVRQHRLRSLGRIQPLYTFYARLLASTAAILTKENYHATNR